MALQKILVIDDDWSVSTGIRFVLEDRYDVATETCASSALNYMAQNRIDLVLLDIKMPGTNGIEALREIRKRHPDITVVMLTAYPSEDNIKKAVELGAHSVMSKPFEIRDLRNYVQAVLAEKGR